MEPELLSPTPFALYELAPPHATVEGRAVPAPPSLTAASARFDTARAAYHGGRYAEAAAAFLDVARTLLRDPDGAERLVAARVAAYRNAASALTLAEDATTAREALASFLEADPACADALGGVVAGPPEP